MPAPKICVATRSLRCPLRTGLELAGRLGADGVELDLRSELPLTELSPSAIRQLRKLLEDLRLRVGVASFPTRRGFGDPAELDRRLEATRAAMKGAGQLGAKVLVVRLGPVPAQADSPAHTLLVESLTSLARHGEHVGVRLALVASGASIDPLPALLAELPSESLGVSIDPAELLADGHSPGGAAALLGGSLLHLYATDAVRDLSSKGAVVVELGRGSVDWPEFLAQLEEHDYQGWATLLLREGGSLGELENAIRYLRTFG